MQLIGKFKNSKHIQYPQLGTNERSYYYKSSKDLRNQFEGVYVSSET